MGVSESPRSGPCTEPPFPPLQHHRKRKHLCSVCVEGVWCAARLVQDDGWSLTYI